MRIAKMIASGVLGGGAARPPEYSSASVVVASPTIVEVCFSKIVQAAGDDFSTGVTITVNTAPVVITSGTLQTDERYVRYVIPAVAVDDVVTWEYDADTGVIVGETGLPVEDISAQTVLNLVGYLLLDDFSTAQTAPITSPRPCDSGLGVFDVTDAANRMSVTGGKLVVATGITGAASIKSQKQINLSVGRAAIFKVQRNTVVYFGLDTEQRVLINSSGMAFDTGANNLAPAMSDEREIAVVMRDVGYWWIDLTNNVLLYTCANANATPQVRNVYLGTGAFTDQAYGSSCNRIAVKDLGAPWNTKDGPCVANSASPANGATIAADADGQIDIEWTPASGGTIDVQFRRTDDDNCLILRADQAGSTLKVIKKETGTETELASGAVTFTAGAGYQITIWSNGSTIKTLTRLLSYGRNFIRNSLASTYNQSSTGAKVVCAGTIANFKSWPKSISAPTFVANPAPLAYFSMGDSKTYAGTYQAVLTANLNTATTQPWTETRSATNNISLDTYANEITTRIALYNYIQDCPHVLVNLGINGVIGAGEAATKADFQTIINACVSRWPACKVYLTKIWNRATADADLNTFAGWIDDLVSANPTNVFVGIDERTVIEGGDDGATNTTDGTHYSAAGATAAAVAWQAVMGY